MTEPKPKKIRNLHRNNFVSDVRQAHGLSQEEFAHIIGMSRSTVANAETGGSVSARLKTAILNEFTLDDVFFDWLDQKQRMAEYERLTAEAVAKELDEELAEELRQELALAEASELWDAPKWELYADESDLEDSTETDAEFTDDESESEY